MIIDNISKSSIILTAKGKPNLILKPGRNRVKAIAPYVKSEMGIAIAKICLKDENGKPIVVNDKDNKLKGETFDIGVIDDPIKGRKQAESK